MANLLGVPTSQSTDDFNFPITPVCPLNLMGLVSLSTWMLIDEITRMYLEGRASFKSAHHWINLATIGVVYYCYTAVIYQQSATPRDATSWELSCSISVLLHRAAGVAIFF